MSLAAKSVDIPDLVFPKRALLSVFDKTGLEPFAAELHRRGCILISTGGTKRALEAAGLPVIDVSEVTQFPEILDGRVKTLHPMVHGGLLGQASDPDHASTMAEHGISSIDLLVSNLYPFEKTIADGADNDTAVENIDIGGPAMTRAAAKNHAFVTVVTDPTDYETVLAALSGNDGAIPLTVRKTLAAKAFARTAAYDSAVSNWFAETLGQDSPEIRSFAGTLAQPLRYGENPHQSAAFYLSGSERYGVATARQLQGKALSYNNINDTDAAFELVSEFDPNKSAAVAIIKHANPCGVALGDSVEDAYRKALRCDSVSAFGGIIAVNQTLDGSTAEAISEIFTEVIIAPQADDAAIEVLARKKNLRLLVTGGLPDAGARGDVVKSVSGGFLVQSRDFGRLQDLDLKVVTKRQPTKQELSDLTFAFDVAKHVKSNAIVYVKDGATVGVGAGQMSRIDSSRIAARKARDAADAEGLTDSLTLGSVVASDAFFPFADGLLSAIEAGATAVIQPGGSMRDDEVIKAADAAGIAMIFTGMRHFRH